MITKCYGLSAILTAKELIYAHEDTTGGHCISACGGTTSGGLTPASYSSGAMVLWVSGIQLALGILSEALAFGNSGMKTFSKFLARRRVSVASRGGGGGGQGAGAGLRWPHQPGNISKVSKYGVGVFHQLVRTHNYNFVCDASHQPGNMPKMHKFGGGALC